ncbi:hypothetical protein [Alteribacillus sp. HJP-4]|uniref:hypothetical protein n=1 Tax=Alteribacillus sp. HJP-4 TaxID=2775394 RepID=UPI0035CCFC0E
MEERRAATPSGPAPSENPFSRSFAEAELVEDKPRGKRPPAGMNSTKSLIFQKTAAETFSTA